MGPHCTLIILLGRWSDTNQSQQCGVVGNPAYDVVHVQDSAGDGLEPDYNMENNPLYEMRIKSNERQKKQLVLVRMKMLTMWLCEEEESNNRSSSLFFVFLYYILVCKLESS